MRELRARNKITMRSLASSLNVSSSYISGLELGRKGGPNKTLLKKISLFFNLDPKQEEDLFLSAKYSQRNLKLPVDIDPDVYRIGYIFSEQASNLTKFQLEIIEKVLGDMPKLECREVNKMNTS
jgi:transcriptional regulator with XRE-family HTH domain